MDDIDIIADNAHALLKAVYQCTEVPSAVRMRAAMACLPFEVPKLIATAQINEKSFAELLDRRIERLKQRQNEMKLIEAQPIEQPEPQPEPKPKPTPAPLNRLYSTKLWRRF
jgi:hypothetical protein